MAVPGAAETIERFYRIADDMNVLLGAVLSIKNWAYKRTSKRVTETEIIISALSQSILD